MHRRRSSRSTCLALEICGAVAFRIGMMGGIGDNLSLTRTALFASHSLRTEAEAEAEDMDFISAFSFSLSQTSTATRGWMA